MSKHFRVKMSRFTERTITSRIRIRVDKRALYASSCPSGSKTQYFVRKKAVIETTSCRCIRNERADSLGIMYGPVQHCFLCAGSKAGVSVPKFSRLQEAPTCHLSALN